MRSDCLNASVRVMSNPVLAMETANRFLRLNRLFAQMTARSHTKAAFFRQRPPADSTLSSADVLCSTSIRVSIPALSSEPNSRRAAMAAPPPVSDVLTISILMLRNRLLMSVSTV